MNFTQIFQPLLHQPQLFPSHPSQPLLITLSSSSFIISHFKHERLFTTHIPLDVSTSTAPIKNENPYSLDKDRIFDLAGTPLYANKFGLTSLLLKENPMRGITHLHVGPAYTGEHCHDGLNCAQQDTVVMEVGAREMLGMTTGARAVAKQSPYNRQGLARSKSVESIDAQTLATTCAGMNTIRELCKESQLSASPAIMNVIIIISSDTLIEGVKNLFNWTKNGFPDTMPEGPLKHRLELLRDHLQYTDANGIEIKFWKVAPEYIHHATFQAECALLDHFDVPPTGAASTCTCGDCMKLKQWKELRFARDGHGCCEKDIHSVQLALKYGDLKKGDMLPFTNNAGITAAVPMLVDAKGFVFGFCTDNTTGHS